MQRLHFNDNEKISRKEYLKRKKKQSDELNGKGRKKYIIIAITSFLILYLILQYYIYNKYNNYAYVAGQDVDAQKIYKLYYVTEGYTYDPKVTINSVESDGFNDKIISKDIGYSKIISKNDFVYGIKNTGLYRVNKSTNSEEMLIEKDIRKFTIYENELYAVSSDKKKIYKVNLDSKEIKEITTDAFSEILVDKNNIYLSITTDNKKEIFSFDKEGNNKKQITKNSNVNMMVQNDTKIFYVNKNDGSKIYSVSKDGSSEEKFIDITCESYKLNDDTVNGSNYMFANSDNLYFVNDKESKNLWKASVKDKTTESELKMSIKSLKNIGNTVFFETENETGVYLYNYNSKFLSYVIKSKIVEFYVEDEPIDVKNRINTLNKN